MALAAVAGGTSRFRDAVFPGRFQHVRELIRLGSDDRSPRRSGPDRRRRFARGRRDDRFGSAGQRRAGAGGIGRAGHDGRAAHRSSRPRIRTARCQAQSAGSTNRTGARRIVARRVRIIAADRAAPRCRDCCPRNGGDWRDVRRPVRGIRPSAFVAVAVVVCAGFRTAPVGISGDFSKLDLVQPAIDVATAEQLIVRADVGDAASGHHQNAIGQRQRGQAMGDQDRRPAAP